MFALVIHSWVRQSHKELQEKLWPPSSISQVARTEEDVSSLDKVYWLVPRTCWMCETSRVLSITLCASDWTPLVSVAWDQLSLCTDDVAWWAGVNKGPKPAFKQKGYRAGQWQDLKPRTQGHLQLFPVLWLWALNVTHLSPCSHL